MRFLAFVFKLPVTVIKLAVTLSPFFFMAANHPTDVASFVYQLAFSFVWFPVLVYFMFLRNIKPMRLPAHHIPAWQQGHPYLPMTGTNEASSNIEKNGSLFYFPGDLDNPVFDSAKSLHEV